MQYTTPESRPVEHKEGNSFAIRRKSWRVNLLSSVRQLAILPRFQISGPQVDTPRTIGGKDQESAIGRETGVGVTLIVNKE